MALSEAYDEKYPNGMFLEGFVFFDNVDSDYETLSIPYLGFRGDWNAAPIFDLATAYDDISELDTTDEKYPLFYTTTLNSLVDGYDVVLGANQFTGTSLPDYFGGSSTSYYNTIRSYLDDLRTNGELNGSYVTISPNEDGKDDIAYAALYLLRNAKALCVVIKDENGNVVNVIGPEYEYFEAKVNDGNRTQQAALTYGTKYNREMYWDGTDSNGNLVKDTFKDIDGKKYAFDANGEMITNTEKDGYTIGEDGVAEEIVEQADNTQSVQGDTSSSTPSNSGSTAPSTPSTGSGSSSNAGSGNSGSSNVPSTPNVSNDAIVSAAYAQLGRTQDCTMLVTNSLAAVGINFHGWPEDYLSLGTLTSNPVPGDIIVYSGHVAIYVGNGQAIHGGWLGNQTVLASVNCGNALIGYVHIG